MVLEKECDKYSAWCPISPATPLTVLHSASEHGIPDEDALDRSPAEDAPMFLAGEQGTWFEMDRLGELADGRNRSAWSLVQQEDSGTSSVAPLSSRTCGIVANELSGGR